VIVALGLVFVFMRMLKKTKPDEIPIEILDQSQYAGLDGADGGGVSVDKLNEMIRQKPENIGAALRGWMATSTTNGKN
jgi:flagellar M-ring protein FliF